MKFLRLLLVLLQALLCLQCSTRKLPGSGLRYTELFILSGILFPSCTQRLLPAQPFAQEMAPDAPDYSRQEHWAALPSKQDPSDAVPKPLATQEPVYPHTIDVFFLHPTSYTRKDGNKEVHWNAALNDARLNAATDETSIKYQASIFNTVGNVYAPRYRQAHINAYFVPDTVSAKAAFDVAYSDVKKAFQYYLKYYNQGRPFIIASHSQGTTHAMRLIKEEIEGKSVQNKLVVAYLVGIPVPADYFKVLTPCENEYQTGCFCTWRTWLRGYMPEEEKGNPNQIVVTNPLTWKTDTTYAPASLNTGAILRNFDKVLPNLVDAQVHESVLWVRRPRFPGSAFIRMRNYHVGDLNFFYTNVRDNAKRREGAFWKR